MPIGFGCVPRASFIRSTATRAIANQKLIVWGSPSFIPSSDSAGGNPAFCEFRMNQMFKSESSFGRGLSCQHQLDEINSLSLV
mmetsp:Transcript_34251/g.71297  ORF Transcript_34251/g.71297 Transcript_34251/m.71297 type:complete len:83 (+) Transcript_34251:126-374(+)